MSKTMTPNTRLQIILIYMMEVILNVRCSNDNRLHMWRALQITNHIYEHISFDSPKNPTWQVLLTPLFKWANWILETLGNLPKVTA